MFRTLLLSTILLSIRLHSDEESALPGRKENQGIYTARFGKTRMFFYMNPEKEELARQLADDVNDRMLHTITEAELDCPVNEITPVATTDIEPIAYNSRGEPLYVDQLGSEIFIQHANDVKKIAEDSLGIDITALSQQMSLIINYDANKFHQDQCPVQYKFIQDHAHPIPEYTIYQDLTLINWEMGKQTLSGTILEDAESEDSFLMCFFDNEICCNVYTEPAIYLGPDLAPQYPGAATLPPHSPIPPIDYCSETTGGSAKGKRISVAVRGLVETNQIDELESRSVPLKIDRPKVSPNVFGGQDFNYENGILLRETKPLDSLEVNMDSLIRLADIDEIEVYTSDSSSNRKWIDQLFKQFEIQATPSDVKVFHLVKKSEGFSRIPLVEMGLEGDYTLFVVNRSKIPEDYRHYPVAHDLTKQCYPWIQFFHFPHDRIMKVDSSFWGELCLTPIDEILFRDGIYDIDRSDPNTIFEKFCTYLHIFAIPNDTHKHRGFSWW